MGTPLLGNITILQIVLSTHSKYKRDGTKARELYYNFSPASKLYPRLHTGRLVVHIILSRFILSASRVKCAHIGRVERNVLHQARRQIRLFEQRSLETSWGRWCTHIRNIKPPKSDHLVLIRLCPLHCWGPCIAPSRNKWLWDPELTNEVVDSGCDVRISVGFQTDGSAIRPSAHSWRYINDPLACTPSVTYFMIKQVSYKDHDKIRLIPQISFQASICDWSHIPGTLSYPPALGEMRVASVMRRVPGRVDRWV